MKLSKKTKLIIQIVSVIVLVAYIIFYFVTKYYVSVPKIVSDVFMWVAIVFLIPMVVFDIQSIRNRGKEFKSVDISELEQEIARKKANRANKKNK